MSWVSPTATWLVNPRAMVQTQAGPKATPNQFTSVLSEDLGRGGCFMPNAEVAALCSPSHDQSETHLARCVGPAKSSQHLLLSCAFELWSSLHTELLSRCGTEGSTCCFVLSALSQTPPTPPGITPWALPPPTVWRFSLWLHPLCYYICFISISPQTRQLKTKHGFVSCVKSIGSASGSLNAAVKVLAGPYVSVKAGLGKGPFSRSSACWQLSVSYRLWDWKLQFFVDCWLEAIFGCVSQWLATWVSSQRGSCCF